MIRGICSLYSLRYPAVLVYMLQNTEYQPGMYLAWYWRTNNFNAVMYRRSLDRTRAARLLLLTLRGGMLLQIIAGLVFLALWYWRDMTGGWQFGLALLLAYPLVWAHLVTIPLFLGRWFVVVPRRRRLIKRSEKTFAAQQGIKLAIAGSYGKTSMKELLLTVFSEGKKVAATPANKNVAVSHAHFANQLDGDEDIVLIEYGEGAPGDVNHFARITHPTHAIITGIAPAHLDRYKTLERAAQDIFSVADFVDHKQVYVNAESPYIATYLQNHNDLQAYDQHKVLGWKVGQIIATVEGTDFTLTNGKQTMQLHSGLIGRHQVGPLALAAVLAHEFGLTGGQIAAGIAKTAPFEHRMQPYQLSGAWVIDDTYNGNIEGVRAGTALLKELEAVRKIYVTPGLVDQGKESRKVHAEMGRLIAEAQPDLVVLMENSAAPAIMAGLKAAGYHKEIKVEDDPLGFYTNLQAFIAAGDVVLMQNDWTDNYA
jgi:UDP-N-acetylmuramoyl-tripeptide--D-alanyl-D-alanine ligase